MKWIFWLLAILTVAAALPAAQATFRLQGFGTGLTDFSGPSRMSISGHGYSTAANWDQSSVSTVFRSRDVGFTMSSYRPASIVEHRFDDHNKNYRTVEYGDWKVQQLDANIRPAQTALRYRNTPAGPSASIVSGSYQGGGRTLGYGQASHAYAQRYNVGAWSNPWVGHSYHQPSTLSAYTAGTNTYY